MAHHPIIHYVTQKGDTLSKIARDHSTTVEEIRKCNPRVDNIHLIYSGEVLHVPLDTIPAADTA